MYIMALRVLFCLLFLRALMWADEPWIDELQKISLHQQKLQLPPELKPTLACQPNPEDYETEKGVAKTLCNADPKKQSSRVQQKKKNTVAAAPANDRCVDAQLISSGTFKAETCSATRDGSTTCQPNSSAPDLWYLFTAGQDQTIAINTFGSSYDTLLSVHSGCPGTTSNQIVCNDDCGSGDSCLNLNVVAGTSYWIRVGGFQQDAGRVVLTLSPQGSFGGRITDAATDAAIPGALILVYNEDAEFVKTITSDSNGFYVADGLAEGNYIARTFNSAGYVDEIHENVVCEGVVCTPDGAALIQVTAGSFKQISFVLDLGGDVRGTVTDANSGNPIQGVEVHIHDLSNNHISAGFTDSGGSYDTLDGLPAGQYIVILFNHDGFVDELYDNIPCVRGICSLGQATRISVTLGSIVNNINFGLDPGGTIIGTVTDAQTLQPVSGVQIAIFDFLGQRISTASSNTTGNYTSFDGLPTGTYFVRTLNFKHYIDELHDNIICTAGMCDEIRGTPVLLTVGSQTQVNFALDLGAIISGTITEEGSGDPLNSILVDLVDTSGNHLNFEVTNSTGNYSTLVGLPSGNYFLKTLNQQGYLDELYDGMPCVASRCDALEGSPIFVEPGNNAEQINFGLTKGTAIGGRIVESATGLPISDTFVFVFDSNFAFTTFGLTDGCGEYSSIHGMLTGKFVAQTSNTFGYIDEVYDDVLCLNGCNLLKGKAIPLILGENAANINFDLSIMLLRDDFSDGVFTWTVKSGNWTENSDFLLGSPDPGSNKASVSAPVPWSPSGATGCSRCTIETAIQTSGGAGGKIILLAWNQNSGNRVELSIREDSDRWKLRQIVNGSVVASAKKTKVIDPGVNYRIKLRYDGQRFQLWVDDELLMTIQSSIPPSGGAGFELRKISASFDYILIY